MTTQKDVTNYGVYICRKCGKPCATVQTVRPPTTTAGLFEPLSLCCNRPVRYEIRHGED
jgi:hypothetical protein